MRFFLISIVYFFISTVGQAQISWLTPGATWYYEVIGFGSQGITIMRVQDDTIIGGHTFTKMQLENISLEWNQDHYELDTTWHMLFANEQGDVVNGYDPDYYGSRLYDFTKIPGDTLFGMWAPGMSTEGIFIVDSIGTIEVGGHLLPFQDIRFQFWPDDNDYYIIRVVEGIGSLQSFFFHHYNIIQPVDAPTYEPICYEDPKVGIIHLRSPEYECDYLLQLVGTEETTPNKTSIYPNPTSGPIYINYQHRNISNIHLYGIDGSFLLALPADLPGTITVDVSELPDGLYMVAGVSVKGNIEFAERIVVQH